MERTGCLAACPSTRIAADIIRIEFPCHVGHGITAGWGGGVVRSRIHGMALEAQGRLRIGTGNDRFLRKVTRCGRNPEARVCCECSAGGSIQNSSRGICLRSMVACLGLVCTMAVTAFLGTVLSRFSELRLDIAGRAVSHRGPMTVVAEVTRVRGKICSDRCIVGEPHHLILAGAVGIRSACIAMTRQAATIYTIHTMSLLRRCPADVRGRRVVSGHTKG